MIDVNDYLAIRFLLTGGHHLTTVLSKSDAIKIVRGWSRREKWLIDLNVISSESFPVDGDDSTLWAVKVSEMIAVYLSHITTQEDQGQTQPPERKPFGGFGTPKNPRM